MQPGGPSQQLLGVEAVREFNVLRDSYGAEYGKRPGAQVIIVTQSGSNQWHGSVYEFLRNNALDAPNYFDLGSAPLFQRNQFGVASGGPLKKDKTFLFANYEGYPAASTPNFGGICTRPGLPCSRRCECEAVARICGRPLAASDPDFSGIAQVYSTPSADHRREFWNSPARPGLLVKGYFFAAFTP